MNIGSDIVKPADARPAGKPDECFYCKRPMGAAHKTGCVIVGRTVVIRVTMEVVVDVPRDWDKDSVEFKYNGSSWCASNFIGDLAAWDERVDAAAEKEREHTGLPYAESICLCQNFEAEFVREATEEDHRTMPVLVDPKDLDQ